MHKTEVFKSRGGMPMSRIALKARMEMTEEKDNFYTRRAKRLAQIDRTSTTFKGKGSISKKVLARSLRLSEGEHNKPYV